ncbi:MAG: DUF2178 domain-containing protein [Patescibacteria group bacterium]
MTKKKFKIIQVSLTMTLAIIIGQSIIRGDYILPIICFVAAVSLIYVLKKRVTEVLADERDLQVAGQAARVAIAVYSLLLALVSIVAIALSKTHPELLVPGYFASYSVCVLLILNVVLYQIYNCGKK